MKRWIGTTTFATLTLAALPATAGPGGGRSAFLESASAQLRWDNVEESPPWVAGAPPRYAEPEGLHIVRLEPGKSVTIVLGLSRILRVHRPGARMGADDLAAWISDGLGLEFALTPLASSDASSLLFKPNQPKTLLVRLVRPASREGAIEVALFVSRVETLARTSGFRELLELPAMVSRLQIPAGFEPEPWWRSPGHTVTLLVKGPAELALETRLGYPAGELEQLQQYQVRLGIDEKFQLHEFATGPDMQGEFFLDGNRVALGLERTLVLGVPEGSHEVRIDGPESLLMRLLRRSSGDFLLESPPELPAAAVVPETQAFEHLRSDFAETRLLGAMRFHQAASGPALQPDERAIAHNLFRRHTQWRHLLPAEKRTSGPLIASWFTNPRLLEPGETSRVPSIAPQHLADALKGFSLGLFVAAPVWGEEGHVYRLPVRRSPSLLRIVALKDSEGRIPPAAEWIVQFDAGAPFTLRATRGPDLPGEAFQASPAAVAQMASPRSLEIPSPIVSVATAELSLLAGAREVRVWSLSRDAVTPLAIQYLSAVAPGSTELEHFEAARRSGTTSSPGMNLLAEWRRWHRGDPALGPEWAELPRGAIPLFRILSQSVHRFEAGSAPPEPMTAPTRRLSWVASVGEGVAQAQHFVDRGEWLSALEAWSAEIALRDPETHGLARLERATALEALGEHFLAERQLRGMFLFDREPWLRQEAFDRLLAIYARRLDTDSLLGMLSMAALELAEPRTGSQIAELLAGQGEHELALLLANSLPEQDRPYELMARCAAKKSWWRVFDASVSRIPGLPNREKWAGIGSAARGYPAEALRHLDAAGHVGVELARSLRASLAIRKDLEANGLEAQGTPGSSQSQEAVRAWATWRVSCPGPHEWRDDPTLVTDSAGGALVYNPARDLLQQYHRALPSRPLKARIVGPVVLRIEARPLHPADSRSPVDHWILVREIGSVYPVAVCGNLPARGLTLIGDEGRVPGAKVAEEVSFGSGLHEIEIGSSGMEILVRLGVQEPELSFQILPLKLSAATFLTPDAVDPVCSALAEGRLGDVLRSPDSSGQYDARSLRRRMTLLVYVAEAEPCLREEARVLGDELHAAHLDAPDLQPLYLRLMGSTQWKPVTSVHSSAGIRKVDLGSWQPESTDLRIRKCLLAPLETGQRLMTASAGLLISLTNEKPTTLQLDLALESLEYLPRFPLTLVCQVDAQEETKVELSPQAPLPYLEWGGPRVPIRLTLPEGEHSVRLWIEKPIVNHFVRVRATELKQGVSGDDGPGEDLPSKSSRTYFVATLDKPLRLVVEGPASLQVDELRDGMTRTSRKWLPAGWQEVLLAPQEGRADALFRVFQRVESDGTGAVPAPALAEEGEAPPPPLPPGAGPVEPGKLVLEDTLALGGQEDGTFSLGLSFIRRKAFNEDGGLGDDTESYLQLDLGHHYQSERLGSYFDTTVLARTHLKEGPLIGAEEDVHAQPEWLPCVLRATGSVYAQWPEGSTLTPMGPPEWSMSLRGALSRRWPIGLKAYHVPSLSVFGRIMSLEKYGAFGSEDIDQDIFTPYKADHRAGLALSETLGYLPWRDTEWWGRAAVMSNENLSPGDPDHLTAHVGWKQLVNGWELDATYMYQRYFNDSDRQGVFERHAVSFLVSRDFWCTPRDRINLSAEIRHDFPDDVNTAFFSLTWYFSSGRGYRDIWPGDESFLELKKQQIPGRYNNSVSEVSP